MLFVSPSAEVKLPTLDRCKVKSSKTVITARNSSYGKVMFSQACVIPSVHWGMYSSMKWADTTTSQGRHPQGRPS